MATFTALSDRDLGDLARAYGFTTRPSVFGIPAGSVNSNYRLETGASVFFLRLYEEQGLDGARAEASLLVHLATTGVPTPPPLATVGGERVVTLAGKPAAVFPWCAGTPLCQAGVGARHAREVGRALAKIHRAGQNVPCRPGRFEPNDLRVRLTRIADAPDPVLASEAQTLGRALHTLVEERDSTLPRGLVHGDLFRDNVLWEGETIGALLDFESAASGVLTYDLMVTVLAWCFGDELDFSLARAMVEGYRELRELEAGERRALRTEGALAALRFTITRITDYAMRGDTGAPRVMKDWRRFARRREAIERLDESELATRLGFPSL